MNAMSSTLVRLAREDEAGTVLRLFVEHMVPIAHFKADLPTMAVEIYNAIIQERIFVADRAGEIIGCAAYVMSRPWYIAHDQMYDQGIFVVPEFRKTRAAYLLKSALEAEAAEKNVTLIFSANTKNPDMAPLMAKRHRKISDVFVVRE